MKAFVSEMRTALVLVLMVGLLLGAAASKANAAERGTGDLALVVERATGSVQIWLEQAMTETELFEQSLLRPDVRRWNLQKHGMYVFDALIANLDRNQGNLMIDRDGTLWFIDHTRAFAQTRELLGREKVTRCSRDLWHALRNLDEASVRQRLEPFLRKGEIRALFKRRAELVAHIEELIAASGEANVLFEIDPREPDPS